MNIIDTRDLQDELNDLQEAFEAIEALEDAMTEAQEAFDSINKDDYEDISDYEIAKDSLDDALEAAEKKLEEAQDEFDIEHYEELKSLKEEIGDEFEHGVQLIDEDDFVEYCEELCKDIGDIPNDLPWYIANHIDWSGVADEIKADYSCVEYKGEQYLYRA